MNQWGLWFTFFVPAFLGGTALGACAMAALFRLFARKKLVRRAAARPDGRVSDLEGLRRCA